ncbi:MAG: helix-turn-helix domain-containing protein [Blautia sp.]
MTTSDMIRELCNRMNISLAELCRRIGQTPQNFNKKLQRGTVSSEEMAKIAEVLDVGYEQAFVLPSGIRIEIKNEK